VGGRFAGFWRELNGTPEDHVEDGGNGRRVPRATLRRRSRGATPHLGAPIGAQPRQEGETGPEKAAALPDTPLVRETTEVLVTQVAKTGPKGVNSMANW